MRCIVKAALIFMAGTFAALADDFQQCDKVAADPDEGIPACTRLVESAAKGTNLAAVYNNRGTGWFLKGLYDNAIGDFTEAIQRNPRFTLAFQNRGRSWYKKQDFDRSVRDLTEAIRLEPKNPRIYTDRGSSLHNKGEFDLAISDFNQAIRLDSKYAPAYLGRADSWNAKRNSDKALSDLNQVIALVPNQPAGYNNRAAVWMDKGSFDQAIADLDRAIALDPKNWRSYSSRGEAWRLKGDIDHALKDHDQAIELNPDSADAYNNRALAWRDKGDLDSAIADYSQALLLNPRYSRAYGNRGEIWRLKGDLDRSLSDLDRAISITPNGPVFYSLRGDTWRYKDQLDRAIADFNEALKISPDDVAALTGRGLTYEKKNDVAHARADFRRAIELPAKFDPARAIPAQETARSHLTALEAAEAERARLAEAERKKQQEQEQEQQNIKAGKPSVVAGAGPGALPGLSNLPPPPGKRLALVIGNAEYRNVQSLRNSGHDAEAVADAFRKVGFQSVALVKNLTREQMVNELRNFSAQAESADWAVVYYAGHGIEVGGINYLVPSDAALTTDRDVQFEAIPLEQVLTAVEPARKLKLVILDSCRENPFLTKMRVSNASRSIGRGLGRIEPSGATLVVYAAKHGQLAMDGDGANSPFVSAFLQRVVTPGIEINKLFRLVRDDVLDATHGKQEPFTYGSLPGREDFYFVGGQ